jgi:PAS domain S-box-containing protein
MPADVAAMTPARILVVEDERVVAWDIQQQLSRIGHTVVGTAASGEDAVELALSTKPHLVLMDIRLEGAMDGIDAARQIRRSAQIPVIFLTAYADDETVRRASQAEPLGYLLKPFEDLQLRTVIEMGLHRHKAECKLRDNARRYATTLASIADAVIATDQQVRITLMNPAAEVLTGWAHNEAEGRPAFEILLLLDETSRADLTEATTESLRTGVPVPQPCSASLIARDGQEVTVDVRGAPILDDDGLMNGAVLVLRDMSQYNAMNQALREAENALAHVGRLAIMGELTGSIAHEVNQPIASAVIGAQAALRWLERQPPGLDEARQLLAQIVKNGTRAGEVIQRIRELIKKVPPRLDLLEINGPIREVIELTRLEAMKNQTSVTAELADGLPLVRGDRVQLQQVMLNLILNAIEAMSGVREGARDVLIRTEQDGSGGVLVSVRDTGPGLNLESIERVFETFYTTKASGLGMGLSICRSIIEAHGGRLWASANEPRGALFQFTLPPLDTDMRPDRQTSSRHEPRSEDGAP